MGDVDVSARWRERRLRRHTRAELQQRAKLRQATGDEFDIERTRLLDLVMCTNKLTCEHLR